MVEFDLTDIGKRGGATQGEKSLNPKQFKSVIYQIPSKNQKKMSEEDIKHFICLHERIIKVYKEYISINTDSLIRMRDILKPKEDG